MEVVAELETLLSHSSERIKRRSETCFIRQTFQLSLFWQLTDCNINSKQKPVVKHAQEQCPSVMKPRGSLSCTQEIADSRYPETKQSSCFNIHLILVFHLYLCHPTGLFPSVVLTKTLYAFLISMSARCSTHLFTKLLTVNSLHSFYTPCVPGPYVPGRPVVQRR